MVTPLRATPTPSESDGPRAARAVPPRPMPVDRGRGRLAGDLTDHLTETIVMAPVGQVDLDEPDPLDFEEAPRRRPAGAVSALLVLAAGVAVVTRVAMTAGSLPASGAESALVDNVFGAITGDPGVAAPHQVTATQLHAVTALTGALDRYPGVLAGARELSVVAAVLIVAALLTVTAVLQVRRWVTFGAVAALALAGPAITVLTPAGPGVLAGAWTALAITGAALAFGWRPHLPGLIAALSAVAAFVTLPALVVPAAAAVVGWLAGLGGRARTARRSAMAAALLLITAGTVTLLARTGVLLPPGSVNLTSTARALLLAVLSVVPVVALLTRWLRPPAIGLAAGVGVAWLAGPSGDQLLPALVLVAAVIAVVTVEDLITRTAAGPVSARTKLTVVTGTVLAALGCAAGIVVAPPTATQSRHVELAGWVDRELAGVTRLVVPVALRPDLHRDLARLGSRVNATGTDTTATATATADPSAMVADADGGAGQELARFGELRVLWTGQLPADRTDVTRADIGTQLAGHPRLHTTPEARAALAGGRVDLRAMAVLAGICQEHDITVASISAPVAEERSPVPLRVVVITELDGRPVTDARTAAPLRDWLTAQIEPYRPREVTLIPQGVWMVWSLPALTR